MSQKGVDKTLPGRVITSSYRSIRTPRFIRIYIAFHYLYRIV